jgi:hypothetical protein
VLVVAIFVMGLKSSPEGAHFHEPLLRAVAVITALAGITLLVSAAVQAILALTVSITEFVGSTPVVRWIIYAAGAIPIVC